MKVYQTDNMELSIASMLAKYQRCVVINAHWCKKRIKLRPELLGAVPVFRVAPNKPTAVRLLEKWKEKGGVLLYRPHGKTDMLPYCEAMLFVEAPLSFRYFATLADRATNEVVVYRPPNWSFQHEVMERTCPSGVALEATLAVFEGALLGEPDSVELAAVQQEGKAIGAISVMRESAFKAMLNMDLIALRKTLGWALKRYFRWYSVHRYNFEPEAEPLKEAYRTLREVAPYGAALRDSPPGVGRAMMVALRNEKAITLIDKVYVMRSDYVKPNFGLQDAMSTAKRADWYKMMNLVDAAPDYDINYLSQYTQFELFPHAGF